jgi:hypothetical protein
MVAADDASARWPHVPPGRGHYESYYLRAVHPSELRGFWIRYTVTVPPGGPPTGQLWFTLFDRSASGSRAVRVDIGEPGFGLGDEWIRLGNSGYGASRVAGEARSDGCSANWSLRHRSSEPPLLHLSRSWMYRARLPRTKLVSLSPATVFDGAIEVDGERIDVDGWPGMIGHNWGEQHAEQWIWLSGLGFDGRGPDSWLDVAVGRVHVGGVTTPWIANGALSLNGIRLPLGGLGRRVSVNAADDGCTLQIPGSGGTVTAMASAPPEAFVEWDYANPDGAVHRVLNCSVADLALTVTPRGGSPLELVSPGRAAYEVGRATDAPPSPA